MLLKRKDGKKRGKKEYFLTVKTEPQPQSLRSLPLLQCWEQCCQSAPSAGAVPQAEDTEWAQHRRNIYPLGKGDGGHSSQLIPKVLWERWSLWFISTDIQLSEQQADTYLI